MFIIGTLLVLILYLMIQTFLHGIDSQDHQHVYRNDSNVTLANMIPDSVLNSWLSSQPSKSPLESQFLTNISDNLDAFSATNTSKVRNEFSNATLYELQNDASTSSFSKDYFLESLFEPPKHKVDPDWSLVLGTFAHYDDENWKEFLIETEVPLFVRMFLSDSSETVTISKKPLGDKEGDADQGYEISIETASWLLSHYTKFQIGVPFIELDFDGTNSKNTFFYSSPRLLVHNKLKDKWRAAIIRNFDEKGLNMTFVDRDRLVVARRFFHRVN